MLSITPLYAAPIAILYVVLSLLVVRYRRSGLVSFGDGGKEEVLKAMRTQENCLEYAPFTLLLLAMIEIQGAEGWLIHAFCAALLVGRLMHAYGFGRTPQIQPLRMYGMILTYIALLGTAITSFVLAI